MKRFFIQIIALVLVAVAGLYIYKYPEAINFIIPSKNPLSTTNKLTTIKIGDLTLNVEVAQTENERIKGLSGREKLAEGSGMLFVFPEKSIHQFWMKEMKFPIDMIFINSGNVVDLLKDVPPPVQNQKDKDLPVYSSKIQSDMVLEVPAGFINSQNIKPDDKVFLIQK
jgi:uncharacterized membrane protein (UPF0127 family)